MRPKQLIYAIYYLLTDTKEAKLSAFFRSSAQPLTSDAAEAAEAMLDAAAAETVRKMFDCFDENNESASVIPEVLAELDERFAAQLEQKNDYASCGAYIKKNAIFFCNTVDNAEQK